MNRLQTFLAGLAFLGLSVSAKAQFSGGSGTSNDPYVITTVAHLKTLADSVNAGIRKYDTAHYELGNDIDLSVYSSGSGWIPIGINATYIFRGVFDGKNKKITNLYISDYSRSNAGVFGRVAGGVVKNLGVENANIRGQDRVGAVVGYLNPDGIVFNCYSTGNIVGSSHVGGVVGNINAGGIVSNCYSTADVGGSSYLGCVAGIVNGSVLNCYSTGTVSGTSYIGGVAGSISAGGNVSNCVALNPSVTETAADVGRIAGYKDATGTLSNNAAWDSIINNAGDTIWANKHTDSLNGVDIGKVFINSDGTLGGRFLSDSGWTVQNGKLPGLFGKTVDMPLHLYLFIPPFPNGDGTSGNPYIITTAVELAELATLVNAADTNYNNKHYKLGNDIELSAYGASFNNGKGWIPIGNDMRFRGVFDGNEKKITGLYINDTTINFASLFGSISGGIVKKLAVENVNISGRVRVGGVVAGIYDSSKIFNCYSTGIINGKEDYVGGVVGVVASNSSLSNCYFTGIVSGNEEIGGIAGRVYLNGSSVSNCYSTAIVSGNNFVGGVAGRVYSNGSLFNCVALNPSVKGTTANVGRVAGFFGATLTNNAAFDSMLNNANNTTWANKHTDSINGADINKLTINTDSTLGGRFTDNVWTTQKYKLPGLFGKTVDMPAHLLVPIPPTITTTSLPDGMVGVAYTANLSASGDEPITWTFEGGNLPTGTTINANGAIIGTPTIAGTFTFTVKATNIAGNAIKGLSITIGSVGIAETQCNASVRVYPNPTSGQLTITNYELRENTIIEIYNVVGQNVGAYPCGRPEMTIDVSHLAAGLYYLKVNNQVIKFIKE